MDYCESQLPTAGGMEVEIFNLEMNNILTVMANKLLQQLLNLKQLSVQ